MLTWSPGQLVLGIPLLGASPAVSVMAGTPYGKFVTLHTGDEPVQAFLDWILKQLDLSLKNADCGIFGPPGQLKNRENC